MLPDVWFAYGRDEGEDWHMNDRLSLLLTPHNTTDAPSLAQALRARVEAGPSAGTKPNIEVLEWLSAARSGEKYDAYLTNRKLKENLSKPLDKFLKAEAKSEREHEYHFRDEKALSFGVDV